jgi:hypothetical protein
VFHLRSSFHCYLLIDHFLFPKEKDNNKNLSAFDLQTFFHRIVVDLHVVSLDSVTLNSLTITSFSKY